MQCNVRFWPIATYYYFHLTVSAFSITQILLVEWLVNEDRLIEYV